MYKITSYFNQKESFRNSGHTGIDFSMSNGTELRSIRDGIVTKVCDLGNQNAGKYVKVKWEDGKEAIYGHLSEFKVTEGQHISAGDLIGLSGNSGHVVGQNGGYHLHFGLKEDGKFINPEPYVNDIQHMNDPNYFVQHAVETPKITGISFHDIMSQYTDALSEIAKGLKFNFIDILTSVDYMPIIKFFHYTIQFIFFYS